ncbi:MAG: O-antigen ligase family protein, partial [Eubacterium sp.]|nr:O-antigen ligase family protein [Eubacterium sp.]
MINWLQEKYISLLSPWIPIMGKVNSKIKYRLLTACFFVDLVLFCIVRYVLHKESYFYNTICGFVIMFAIAILSLDRKLEKKTWRRSICVSWFGMCALFTLSDFLVTKKVCGLGLVLAFVFTMVFFVWQNNSRKDLLWKSFKDAVKIAFVIIAVLAFLFRPFFDGGRYAAIFTNPNTFGLYIFVVFAVYMSDLDWNVEIGKCTKRCIGTYFMLALCIFYLIVSQARTALLAVIAIFAVWLYLRISNGIKEKRHKHYLKTIGMLVLFSVVLFPVFFISAKKIPYLVGHPIIFQEDVLYLSNGEKIESVGDKVINESDNIESVDTFQKKEEHINVIDRIIKGIMNNETLNNISSGRLTIYKAYMSKLNFSGHKRITMNINGKKVSHAHNNWLQFAYTYGILSLVMY